MTGLMRLLTWVGGDRVIGFALLGVLVCKLVISGTHSCWNFTDILLLLLGLQLTMTRVRVRLLTLLCGV